MDYRLPSRLSSLLQRVLDFFACLLEIALHSIGLAFGAKFVVVGELTDDLLDLSLRLLGRVFLPCRLLPQLYLAWDVCRERTSTQRQM